MILLFRISFILLFSLLVYPLELSNLIIIRLEFVTLFKD